MTLIDRLSKLDGPDREVDGIIAETFGYPQDVFGSSFGTDDVDGPDMHYDAATWSGEGKSWSAPYFTASVDAALALAERVLPGKARKIVWKEGKAIVVISQAARLWEVAPTVVQTHNSAAIALCIALLRAKEASYAGN